MLSDAVDYSQASVLLAVSGGRDSMCMLDLFARRIHDCKRIVVASVHHGMRGDAATADIEFVREIAKKYAFEFHAIYLNPQELQGSGGFEARARAARYRELLRLKAELELDYLCTAHHADDQAETILLRMMRGTGLLGLRGIHTLRADGVLRPLLHVSRDELLGYALTHGVAWREDHTNASLQYTRNRVRHQLLPILSGEDPQLVTRLCAISVRVQKILAHIVKIPLAELSSHKNSELYRIWLGTHGTLISSGKLAQVAVKPHPKRFLCAQVAPLSGQSGSVSWGGNMYLLAWQLRDRKDLEIRSETSANVVWIDADHLTGVPEFRTRREGDHFSPPGLRSMHRKLKKFFQEKGVDRDVRDSIPLLALEDQVLWIVGYAVSGNFQVQSKTQTVLELRLTCHRTTN